MTPNETRDERLAALLEEEPELWTVADETQTVEVSVDARGSLRTLRLASSWWRNVSPEELGSVVLRLRQASLVSRLNTIAELEKEGYAAPAVHEPPSEPAPGGADDQSMSQLSARLGTVLAAFAELDQYRRAITAATTEATVLRAPSGNASLELVGGSPRRLVIDRLNVQFISERALSAEIVELFARAESWLDERKRTTLHQFPDLAGVVHAVRDGRPA